MRRVHAPPKVGDLHVAAQPDQQVFGLDVAVDDVLGVAVAQRAREARDVRRGARLGEAPRALQLLVQLAARGVLEDEVDLLLFEFG